MKRLFFFICIAFAWVSCGGQKTSKENHTAVFQKVTDLSTERIGQGKDSVNLGRMKQGEIIEFLLGVRNADSIAMVILDIKSSCGCTSLSYDRQPILPGDTASIRLQYDSKGQFGIQYKSIQVTTTLDPNPFNIHLQADVHP